MRFEISEIVGRDRKDWGRLLRATESVRAEKPQRIFRALGAWNRTVRYRKAKITSSFDDACERSVRRVQRWKRRLYESLMLFEFKREAYHHLAHLPPRKDFLAWLALGRHYEMPTRLVDFTYSFYVAAYFALSKRGSKEDGCILALKHGWLKERAEDWRKENDNARGIPEDRASFHDPRLFYRFAFELQPVYVIPVNPLRRNRRLARQQGLFLCPGDIRKTFEQNLEETLNRATSTDKPVKKLICLRHELRSEAMLELRRMNIGMATLLPDLSGWAQSQRDHVHKDISGYDDRFKQELEVAISPSPRS
jgi:hypothetical protein